MKKRQYELVVVGAGPAGARAAETAASRGMSVLMVDKKQEVGRPLQCAEFVPLAVRKYVSLAPGSVSQQVTKMLTYINDQLSSVMGAPGYILERPVFEQGLVRHAQQVGAELQLGVKVIACTNEGAVLQHPDGHTEEVNCEVIIGADGPRSTVGSWMESQNQEFLMGLQYRMELAGPLSATEIYFQSDIKGGYAWLFPKARQANVGLAVDPTIGNQLPNLLQEFVRKLVKSGKLQRNEIYSKVAGLIPAGGPLGVTQKNNLLLVGDAAGHTHAITGAGIMTALICGEIAGKIAAKAICHQELEILKEYPREWQTAVGRYLWQAAACREDLDRNWVEEPEQFAKLIQQNWIGLTGKAGREETTCSQSKKVLYT